MNLANGLGGGDEMIAIFWFTRLFGRNNTKYLSSGECCRPLAFDGIVANLPQGSPSSTAIGIPMTAEQQADLCFFATYLHIRLED